MTSSEAAKALADIVVNEMLMPFTFWEVDGVFIVVYQGAAADSFRRICLPVASIMHEGQEVEI